jgi:hypothetical protein
VLLLDLFGLLFVSNLVNQQNNNGDNRSRRQQAFKYYSNRKGKPINTWIIYVSSPNINFLFFFKKKKGSRVVEVDREGKYGCHVFEDRDAAWFLQTRGGGGGGGTIKTLNYIQFEILLQTCHPDMMMMMQNSSAGKRRNSEEGFKDESELNKDILMEKWNKTMKPSNFLPEMMDMNTYLFNDKDVSLFMDELDKKNGTELEEEEGTPLIYPGK